MPEKFDFSKIADQEQFAKLPKEERDKIVNEAQEETGKIENNKGWETFDIVTYIDQIDIKTEVDAMRRGVDRYKNNKADIPDSQVRFFQPESLAPYYELTLKSQEFSSIKGPELDGKISAFKRDWERILRSVSEREIKKDLSLLYVPSFLLHLKSLLSLVGREDEFDQEVMTEQNKQTCLKIIETNNECLYEKLYQTLHSLYKEDNFTLDKLISIEKIKNYNNSPVQGYNLINRITTIKVCIDQLTANLIQYKKLFPEITRADLDFFILHHHEELRDILKGVWEKKIFSQYEDPERSKELFLRTLLRINYIAQRNILNIHDIAEIKELLNKLIIEIHKPAETTDDRIKHMSKLEVLIECVGLIKDIKKY